MFKALVQYGAGEAMLLATIAVMGSVLAAGFAVAFAYAIVEYAWDEDYISNKIIEALNGVIEN